MSILTRLLQAGARLRPQPPPGQGTALSRPLAAASKNPGELTGVVDWWRTDSGVSGSPVASWTGMVAATVLSQGTGSRQPTVVPNELNGFDAIRFDGLNDNLFFPGGTVNVAQPLTILFVYRKSAAFSGLDCLVGQVGQVNVCGDGVSTTAGYGTLRTLTTNVLGPVAQARACAFVVDGAATSKFYFNESGSQLFPALSTGSANLTAVTLGALAANGANACECDLFEYAVIAGEVSTSDLNAWGQYVFETFGLAWTGI